MYEYQILRFERFSLDMLMLFQFAILCHLLSFEMTYLWNLDTYLPDSFQCTPKIAEHSFSVTSELHNFMSHFMCIVYSLVDQNKVRKNQDLKLISHDFCLERVILFTQVQYLCAK